MLSDGHIEVLTQPERRRRWTVEQKLQIVAELRRPGASPTQLSRRYGVSPGLLYTWRRLAREGTLSLVPVRRPEMTNNAAEHAICLVAFGSNNWIFAGSDQGGVLALCEERKVVDKLTKGAKMHGWASLDLRAA